MLDLLAILEANHGQWGIQGNFVSFDDGVEIGEYDELVRQILRYEKQIEGLPHDYMTLMRSTSS